MKRIICSITMFLVSISVYGETTRLECIVSGEIRGSFLGKTDPDKSRKIDKETVNVEISQYKNGIIIIDVQGRKDLEIITSTKRIPTTLQLIDGSTKNSYSIKTVNKDTEGEVPTTISEVIKIDRVTGKIYVDRILDGSGLGGLKTNYFGSCENLGDNNKF